MDVKGNKWNYEQKLIRMWVGYMWDTYIHGKRIVVCFIQRISMATELLRVHGIRINLICETRRDSEYQNNNYISKYRSNNFKKI